MDESEMLEFAAKAAGWSLFYYGSRCTVQTEPGKLLEWNPLTDDGDALRLAVKLNMMEEGSKPFVELMWRLSTETGIDDYAATRRAITRAAAEIGRAMP